MAKRRTRRDDFDGLGALSPVATAPLGELHVFGIPLWAALLGGGVITAGVVFMFATGAGGVKLTDKQKAAFLAALPASAKNYGQLILRVAEEVGIDPFALYGLGDRETGWGTASAYKQQAGDWTPRLRSDAAIARLPAGALVAVPTPSGKAEPVTGTHYVMPADGLGYGRGLMQIDYEAQYPWVSTHAWQDDYTNVKYGASYFKSLLGLMASKKPLPPFTDGNTVTVSDAYAAAHGVASGGTFPDPRPLAGGALVTAAIASYNTGPGNVIRNLALKLPADASTTGGDYAGGTVSRMNTLIAAYQNAGGTGVA